MWAGATTSPDGRRRHDTNPTGGSISISSGYSANAHTGDISKFSIVERYFSKLHELTNILLKWHARTSTALQTPDAGKRGVSGGISFSTGWATEGASGKIDIQTGSSVEGKGGEINILAGTSSSQGYRPEYDGADITLVAGDTTAKGGVGGAIQIGAGRGLHDDRRNGGRGGEVVIVGGGGHGLNKETSVGTQQIFLNILMPYTP